MYDFPTKYNTGEGSPNTVSAEEYNSIANELENVITSAGITLNSAAVTQLALSISKIAGGGIFYTDSGSANTYILSNIGSYISPTAYYTGMEVAFVPLNTSTSSAVTVNVEGLGNVQVKNLQGGDLTEGAIALGTYIRLVFDGTVFRLISNSVSAVSRPVYLGAEPEWASSSTVTIPANVSVTDDTNSITLSSGSGITVNITTSGAGGLDTGSVSASAKYFIWLCQGSSGTTAVFSLSNSSPTLPTGYTTYKRRLPGCWITKSSNILNQDVTIINNNKTRIRYRNLEINVHPYLAANSGTTLILNEGGATSFTSTLTTPLSTYMAPTGYMASLYCSTNAVGSLQGFAYIRPTGDSGFGITAGYSDSIGSTRGVTFRSLDIHTNASQSIEYKTSNSNMKLTLFVLGYEMKEI